MNDDLSERRLAATDACGAAARADAPRCLSRCDQVTVCELTGVERFVVWAIRWRTSSSDSDAFADACLEDSFDRAGLRAAQPAFERFVRATCPVRRHCPAVERLGCWRLSPLEAHALHAIACLQSGLLGEAWKSLGRVCSRGQVARALADLNDLAEALERIGGRVERWALSG
jgi:hypothetical protein